VCAYSYLLNIDSSFIFLYICYYVTDTVFLSLAQLYRHFAFLIFTTFWRDCK